MKAFAPFYRTCDLNSSIETSIILILTLLLHLTTVNHKTIALVVMVGGQMEAHVLCYCAAIGGQQAGRVGGT